MATREEARQQREAKLDELHEKLTGAVERLVTGEDWADAMRFAARFRSRSFNNGPYPRILDTGCDYAAVGSVAARRAS